MDKSASKAARTRQFIIETTAGIFNTKGFAGTSMSDLTEATGLTKGSIYGNFENKEEVAGAVFDYNHGKVSRMIRQRMDQAVTYYDKLMVYPRVYDQFNRNTFPLGGCPILNTSVEADDTNILLKERAAKAVQKWKKDIQDLIRAGIAHGEFRKDIDDIRMSLSVIALIEGAIMISKITNSQASLDKIIQTVEILIREMKV